AADIVGDDAVAPKIDPAEAAHADAARAAVDTAIAGDQVVFNGHGLVGHDVEALAFFVIVEVSHDVDAAAVVVRGIADDPVEIDRWRGITLDPDPAGVVLEKRRPQDDDVERDLGRTLLAAGDRGAGGAARPDLAVKQGVVLLAG